ncbi:MAG: flagellar basal body L-ring protein FlgH [Balneolaceae bacterium]|nr:MAG: flagellar basal body L-ring protein FlgH [Balneolaceae bacterium]
MDKNIMKIVKPLLCFLTLLFAGESLSAQHSLYSDVKARQVGDVITIVLVENISGSTTSDARSASNTDGSVGGSVTGSFLPVEPTFGAGAQVSFDSDQRNLASQRQLLEGYLSVQVMEVDARGNLIVEGSRKTEINGELHEMSLKGLIRTNDVDSMNRILSYKLANAEITYKKRDGPSQLLSKSKSSMSRNIFKAVAVGLVAVIVADQVTN